eukprot:m.29658 g.29658  ORF g.29658 m.29658 type:complete len:186 (-) comp6175_c0_seq1:101-658(-)
MGCGWRGVVVMGVCGCGKSTIGHRLAEELGCEFIDGDDLHPIENVDKMSRGEPLNDEDRQPWLETIHNIIFNENNCDGNGVVIACSALRQCYRDIIRGEEGMDASSMLFLFLEGSEDIVTERMRSRTGHFMKEDMVKSQYETLEVPQQDVETDVVTINIAPPIDTIISRAKDEIRHGKKGVFKHG